MSMKMEYNTEDSRSIWKSFFSTRPCLRLVGSVLNQHEPITFTLGQLHLKASLWSCLPLNGSTQEWFVD